MDQTVATNSLKDHVLCPQCGKKISCYDPTRSRYFACASCDLFFEVDDKGNETKSTKLESNLEKLVSLEIGNTGTIDGNTVRVTGIVQKRDDKEGISWFEYLLHSPGLENYMTLAEIKGHWSLIGKSANQDFEPYYYDSDYWVQHGKKRFTFYTSYLCEIVFAMGEFDWDVVDHARHLKTEEYILPPQILVNEIYHGPYGHKTNTWYEGRHMEAAEVASAFKVPISQLPAQLGLGALQPNPATRHWKAIMTFTSSMVALVFLTQFLLMHFRPERTLLSQELYFTPDNTFNPTFQRQISEPFEVHGPANIAVELKVDLYNEWVEVPVTLVNNANGTTYDAGKAIEYYQGYEQGEYWSEGSSEETIIINNVPSGTYHLNIEAFAANKKNYLGYLKVKENTILYSNLILMLIALLAYPALLIFIKFQMEEKRWS